MPITPVEDTAITSGTTGDLQFVIPPLAENGDILVAGATVKPYNLNINSGTILTDFVLADETTSGTVANGNGVGSNRTWAFTRVHDGSDTTRTGTLSASASPRMSHVSAFRKNSPLPWDIASCGIADTTPTGTQVLMTAEAMLNLKRGDMLVLIAGGPDDTVGDTVANFGTNVGSHVINNGVLLRSGGTTSGNDAWYQARAAYVSTALQTDTIVTVGGTLPNSGEASLAGVLVRLREVWGPVTPFSSLIDTFDTEDNALWNYEGSFNGVNSGLLYLSGIAQLYSKVAFNLIGSQMIVDLTSTPTAVDILLGGLEDIGLNNNRLAVQVYENSVVTSIRNNAGTTVLSSTSAVPPKRYLRISENAGLISIDNSDDGVSNWVPLRTPFNDYDFMNEWHPKYWLDRLGVVFSNNEFLYTAYIGGVNVIASSNPPPVEYWGLSI